MSNIIDYLDISSPCFFTGFKNPVWADEFPNTSMLDSYFMLKYGKRVSFDNILSVYAGTDGKITGANMLALSDLIYTINKRKWEHLWKVYQAEYSPIENTDVYEEVTEDNSLNRVIDSDRENSSSIDTDTSTSANRSGSDSENRFGFNSSSAVGDRTGSSSQTASGSTDENTRSSGSESEDTVINDDEDKLLKRHKHGNIGVTENVTMLQHEIEFWKWSFIDAVCRDICDVIALSIY